MDPDSAAGLLSIIRLLEALLAQGRYQLTDVLIGRFPQQEILILDTPGPGAKRMLVDRQGQGASAIAVSAGIVTPVIPANEGRIGGAIVNTGTGVVTLYLCPPGDIGGSGNAVSGQAANRPAIGLISGGGSWDFRLGNALYGGDVSAVGVAASSLTVAEF